ncbi:alpha/beta fold hydrolase [Herpetosiphon geysericola]|uniref:Alpha/beta hydrolase n=1 Tax=Herpetosiphon geysericola TaxID=70996 RepID=A0A0N8GR57_9CHLR|nr:alpha/beta hydrolase [Herpetosiphon geysericola]KPL85570.1 alpha/beta hydrolase [Herpetosiphon geysericola]
MLNPPLLAGLTARVVQTPRLAMHVLERGDPNNQPIVLVHGNVSAARFWEELMLVLPDDYYVIAPDLRSYGRSERLPLDATRGVRDFSDDLDSLLQTLNLRQPHLVGWSLGGNIILQYALDYAANVRSLTLVAPGSPYGYGGTHGHDGQPNSPDYAGSGGGTANAAFVEALKNQDRGAGPVSPRTIMNSFYFKPPFRSSREDMFVDEMLQTYCSPQNYPGDLVASENWPLVAPGTGGVNNALSPKYLNQSSFATIQPQPPVLWIRGDADQIVSDASMFDLCMLGQLGLVPGWPGAETHPAQPMVGQMRAVLENYAAHGGDYQETVLANCGHSPHIEQPSLFNTALLDFLTQV